MLLRLELICAPRRKRLRHAQGLALPMAAMGGRDHLAIGVGGHDKKREQACRSKHKGADLRTTHIAIPKSERPGRRCFAKVKSSAQWLPKEHSLTGRLGGKIQTCVRGAGRRARVGVASLGPPLVRVRV